MDAIDSSIFFVRFKLKLIYFHNIHDLVTNISVKLDKLNVWKTENIVYVVLYEKSKEINFLNRFIEKISFEFHCRWRQMYSIWIANSIQNDKKYFSNWKNWECIHLFVSLISFCLILQNKILFILSSYVY